MGDTFTMRDSFTIRNCDAKQLGQTNPPPSITKPVDFTQHPNATIQVPNNGKMLVRSTLVIGSALPDACQLRPDSALTETGQLNNLIQLSRGSFAASVWGHVKMCDNPLLVFTLFHCGSRHSTKPAWDCVYWANLHPNNGKIIRHQETTNSSQVKQLACQIAGLIACKT